MRTDSMLGRLAMLAFKVLLMALALFLLMNMFWIPQVGRFSCGVTPWFLPTAQADTGCPDSIDGAMNDALWATDRNDGIKSEPKTVGQYYDENGRRHRIRSGDEKGVDAVRALDALRAVGAESMRGYYPAATHVEVKVAAFMREAGVRKGVVVINHELGPCEGELGLSCQEVLPLVLPAGSTLRVWYVPKGKPITFDDFIGR